MKKLGLLILGGIAGIILLVNLGPIVLFGLSIAILYYSLKGFMKADTSLSKLAWAVVGLILFSATVSNVPALAGIVSAIVLYFVYKKWNEKEEITRGDQNVENDPFVNFEKEWAELKRNY